MKSESTNSLGSDVAKQQTATRLHLNLTLISQNPKNEIAHRNFLRLDATFTQVLV